MSCFVYAYEVLVWIWAQSISIEDQNDKPDNDIGVVWTVIDNDVNGNTFNVLSKVFILTLILYYNGVYCFCLHIHVYLHAKLMT